MFTWSELVDLEIKHKNDPDVLKLIAALKKQEVTITRLSEEVERLENEVKHLDDELEDLKSRVRNAL